MSKRTKILMLTNIVAVILLLGNFSSTTAVSPGWNAGDIFLWGVQYSEKTTTYLEEEGIGDYSELLVRSELEFNITALNTLDKEYDVYETDFSGTVFRNDRNYGAEAFVNSQMDIEDFFDINFVWDFEHNVTSLIKFNTGLNPWFLIEPDFALINAAFPIMLNGTYLIDTVVNPYNGSIVYNFTLGDTLDAAKINIMGRSSLANAVKQFSDTKTKWTFEFDLSNYITERQWNGTMQLHTPYDVYKETWEFKYTKEGVLDTVIYTHQEQITIDGEVYEEMIEERVIIGGMKAASTPFSTVSVIGGLCFIAVIGLVLKHRKK